MEILDQYLLDHRVTEHIAYAENNPVSDAYLERIDKDVTRGMQHACKKLRRYKKVPFSPAMHKATQKKNLYDFYRRQHKMGKNWQRKINQIHSDFPGEFPVPTSVDDAQTRLREAQKELWGLFLEAARLREEFQAEMIISKKLEGKLDDAKKLELIKKGVGNARMYEKFQYLKGKDGSSTGISHILVPSDGLPPDEAKEWAVVSDPREIKGTILGHLVGHFNQCGADATPPMQGELGSIPTDASGDIADAILQGTYQVNPEDDAAAHAISQ